MECPDKSEGRNKNQLVENYDIAVVGAGHAGCEAALACARLGLETIIFTVSVDSIALMPCNPNIGGSSKGHLVREIDALGGQMGINIDKTFIQSKMLNRSKGPAVHSLRAQADKADYSMQMRMTLQRTDHLTIRQAEVAEIITEDVKSVYSSKEDNSSYQENFNGVEALDCSCKDSLSGAAEGDNSYKDIRAFDEDVCQEEKYNKNNFDLIRDRKSVV